MATGRSYTLGSVEWPSVTTILGILDKGDALLGWAVKCALAFVREHALVDGLESTLEQAKTRWREARDEAADIGKETHERIRVYIQHGQDATGDIKPEVQHAFLAFLEWERQNKIEWLESEKMVCDPKHGYAGTFDAKCRFGAGPLRGRVFIIDFKSSKAFYDGYAEQVAAYRYADSLTTATPADGCGLLRLDKETGEPEWKDVSDVYEDRLAFFFKIVEAYYLQKGRRLKGNPYVLRRAA